MGIYIKGMRMPENCIKCPVQFGGMCYVMPAEVDDVERDGEKHDD